MTQQREATAFGEFLAELRRRHVVRFALGYAAAAFVVLQLAEIVFPAFGIGERGLRVLVIVATLGFPPSVVLAWIFDLTSAGLSRTGGGSGDGVLPKLALLLVTVAAMGGAGLWLANAGAFVASPGASIRSSVRAASFDPSMPIRSLAVLPLQDFSPGGDQAYFTAGMHEELIAKLSRLEGVRVVSRTTVMRYADSELTSPEIGDELNVEVLIEGSVSRSGERVRITLQIIHAPSDSHIETLQWDQEVTDVLSLQSEVAHAVAMQIDSAHEDEAIVQTAMSDDPSAQEAYLKGRMEYDRGTLTGYRASLDYFEEALEVDADFAPAMTGAAGARFVLGMEDPGADTGFVKEAHADAMRAVALNPDSEESREVLTLIERSMDRFDGGSLVAASLGDMPAPVREVHMFSVPGLTDSIMIDMEAYDTAWVAAVTTLGQRLEEVARRTSDAGSGPSSERGTLEARQLMAMGRFDEASDVLRGVVTASPNAQRSWDMLARSQVASGRPNAAVQTMGSWSQTGQAGAPTADDVAALGLAVRENGADGYWSWTLERLDRVRAQGVEVPAMAMASAHAALDHPDEAFEFLSQALQRGERGVFTLQSDPSWDALRDDERFRHLVREARRLRYSPRTPRAVRGPGL